MYINHHYPFEVLPLPYDPKQLEPYLCCPSFLIHYNEIYRGYVNKLNHLLKDYPSIHNWSLDEIIYNSNLLPTNIESDAKYLASAIYNHQVFFNSITPYRCEFINTPLTRAIDSSFININNFLNEFTKMAKELKGCGYVFMCANEAGKISLYPTFAQNSPIPANLYPLMGIDMWEHSYYLDFQTNKDRYIQAFIALINWAYLNSEYIECLKFVNENISA